MERKNNGFGKTGFASVGAGKREIKIDDLRRRMNCRVHGKITLANTVLRGTKNPYRQCLWCKRAKDRETSQRYRENHREYYVAKSKEHRQIRRSLSVYLSMILFAAEIRPD